MRVPHQVEMDLTAFLRCRFDLDCMRVGYRYAPWMEVDGEYIQGVLCGERVIRLRLKTRQGKLLLGLESNSILSPQEIAWLRERVIYCLGLKDDLSPIYELAKGDENLKQALLALPGYRLKATPTLYEAIISAMLSQNCSAQVFFSMREKLIRALGRKEEIGGDMVYAFPLPKDIHTAEENVLREMGLYYRTKFIREVAQHLSPRFLQELRRTSPAEGIAALRSLKGIGEYTARVVQIYGLRRFNLGFVDGYVQKLLGMLYLGTLRPKPKEIFALAQSKWGEWQAYALDLLIAYWQGRSLPRDSGDLPYGSS